MQQVLGVAIGIALVCLLLSIIASHVQEVGAAFTARRAASLEVAIHGMLQDPDLLAKFYGHPLIQNISFSPLKLPVFGRKAQKTPRPTYISSKLFSRVLATIIQEARDVTVAATQPAPPAPQPEIAVAVAAEVAAVVVAKVPDTDAGKAAAVAKEHLPPAPTFAQLIAALPDGNPLKQRLRTLVLGIEHDAAACNLAVEEWYDGTMDRVNGLYKRDTQWILLGLGLVLAIVCNANLFSVTSTLWRSQAARDEVASVAQMYACPPEKACTPDDIASYTAARQSVENDLKSLPIGYQLSNAKPYWDFVLHGNPKDQKMDVGAHLSWLAGDWSYKLFGWFLTAIAVSLGAPFWFDMLNKVINLRLNGAQPAKADKQKTH
ncbi:hypothetical protein [Paracidobacterium acidisoli]|uniref:Uncharacterized protein n=1 Tax=Paracidobacterium acidisoli TaxID=2303751 RepID=A0A372IUJ3_9BACT|nr:hypothetical protein [Paracidobacterium acidisoli]MBT9330071.1 hypothetical protein [Paracidobacterium acidisoli]